MASENYWSYKAPAPATLPPRRCDMTQEQWEQLSPGYRREITRYMQKLEQPKDLFGNKC